jgi:uncharacterized SAM-binding protein YcdF (DUF218 family)
MNRNLREKKKSAVFSPMRTIGVLVFLVILPFITYLALRAMGAYLIISSEIDTANAIVVLSGGDETRLTEALRLYNQNYAHMIILTETGQKLEDTNQLYSFDMRIVLLSNGVPSGNILITNKKVSSTRDEALAVKNLMKNQQMTSAIIVTDPYHTRRAFGIFQEIFKGSGVKLMIQPATQSWYNSRTWFLKLDGWKYTFLEYLKLLGDKLNIVLD